MLSHDEIREALTQGFQPKYGADVAVNEIARYQNAALGLPRRRAQVLLPDLHLLGQHDAPAYPKWGFLQDEDVKTCLDALAKLKTDNPGKLRVWQLGDLFDIWRARGGRGDAAEVNGIAADHADILEALLYAPPHGTKAELLAGNHDFGTFSLSDWKASRFRILENDDPQGGDVLVVHGDLFDWLEGLLPDELQAAAVRFATWHASGQKDLYNDADTVALANRRLKSGDSPIGAENPQLACDDGDLGTDVEAMNVIDGEKGDSKADNKKFYGEAKKLVEALRDRGYNVRVVVVGHTHWARIVAGAVPGDEGTQPFVLLDAGAWIGRCRLTPDQDTPIHNGQVAVMVGDDLRVYQLGWRPVG